MFESNTSVVFRRLHLHFSPLFYGGLLFCLVCIKLSPSQSERIVKLSPFLCTMSNQWGPGSQIVIGRARLVTSVSQGVDVGTDLEGGT